MFWAGRADSLGSSGLIRPGTVQQWNHARPLAQGRMVSVRGFFLIAFTTTYATTGVQAVGAPLLVEAPPPLKSDQMDQIDPVDQSEGPGDQRCRDPLSESAFQRLHMFAEAISLGQASGIPAARASTFRGGFSIFKKLVCILSGVDFRIGIDGLKWAMWYRKDAVRS